MSISKDEGVEEIKVFSDDQQQLVFQNTDSGPGTSANDFPHFPNRETEFSRDEVSQ